MSNSKLYSPLQCVSYGNNNNNNLQIYHRISIYSNAVRGTIVVSDAIYDGYSNIWYPHVTILTYTLKTMFL